MGFALSPQVSTAYGHDMRGPKQDGFETTVSALGVALVLTGCVVAVVGGKALLGLPVMMLSMSVNALGITHYYRRLGRPHGMNYSFIIGGLIMTWLQLLFLAIDQHVTWLAALTPVLMLFTLGVGITVWGKWMRFPAQQTASAGPPR